MPVSHVVEGVTTQMGWLFPEGVQDLSWAEGGPRSGRLVVWGRGEVSMWEGGLNSPDTNLGSPKLTNKYVMRASYLRDLSADIGQGIYRYSSIPYTTKRT